MATKQLLEETTQNRFYPVIEVAGSLESNINLPPTLALVKDKFLYKGDGAGSDQSVEGLITFNNNNGIKVKKISQASNDGITVSANNTSFNGSVNIYNSINLNMRTSDEAIRIKGDAARSITAENGLKITSLNGSVEVDAPSGPVTISSGNGDVSILPASGNDSAIYSFKNVDASAHPVQVGAENNPIFIDSSGHFQAFAASVGSSTKPIFLDSGTLTASNASVGSDKKIMYLSSGVLTESATDVAKSSQIMYLDDGELKAGYTFLLSDPIS